MNNYLDTSLEQDLKDLAKLKGTKDINDYRFYLYIVLVQATSGLVAIRAVCTEQWIAEYYRKALKHHQDVIKVWTERTLANHLYGMFAFEQSRYPTPGLLQQTGFPK